MREKASFSKTNFFVLIVFLLLILFCAFIFSSLSGAIKIPVNEFINLLLGKETTISETEESLLTNIRLPRVILAIIVGAALGVSGAVVQCLFRNPLAEPGLVGVSSGAALGVSSLIIFGSVFGITTGVFSISIFAFIGALLAANLVLILTKASGTTSTAQMLLIGIAINAIAGSGIAFLTFISDDMQLRTFIFWTLGSLSGADWENIKFSSIIIFPAILFLIFSSRKINLLLLGDDDAKLLGINTERFKAQLILVISLMVGISVAVTGIIGFLGLIVPHLVRLFVGSDNRYLIPASALLGSIILLMADTLSRILLAPTEIPVGALISLIGGPFFLWLLFRRRARSFSGD